MSRRAVIATGVAVLALYAALAFVSGRLSPLARGPLLDGLGPLGNYNWVHPPPQLASGNVQPSSGSFAVKFDANGSQPNVFVTQDAQVTVIVPKGAFASHAGDSTVQLTIDPLDPTQLSPPGHGLEEFGNVYRLKASYKPSGATAQLAAPLDVILLYPSTPNLHSSRHELITSIDGKIWTPQHGTDSLASQQAEGPMPALGYVVVAGRPGKKPTSATPTESGSSGGGGNAITIALLVVAVGAGLVGIGLILRNRR